MIFSDDLFEDILLEFSNVKFVTRMTEIIFHPVRLVCMRKLSVMVWFLLYV